MKLSIVVPCYNEEKNVNYFYSEFVKVFKKFRYDFEFIFVDDGSNDDTLMVLKRICEKANDNIKIISFSRNFGKEAAMYAGLKEASGEYVAIVDSDLQQRPEVLLDMYDILDKNSCYDCVAAYQEMRNEKFILKIFKSTFYKLINKISDIEFVRGASDFRIFKRNVRDAIVSMGEYNRFTKGIFSFVGFNTYYMPYQVELRVNGVSKWNFMSLFKYAVDGIISFSTLPLKFASFLGGLTILGSFIYLIVALIMSVNITTMMMFFIITFFSGVQLLTIGILSRYMASMHGEIKKRPIYITKEVLSIQKK